MPKSKRSTTPKKVKRLTREEKVERQKRRQENLKAHMESELTDVVEKHFLTNKIQKIIFPLMCAKHS